MVQVIAKKHNRSLQDEQFGSATPISVIIPAYNESGAISEVIRELEDVLRSTGREYEIIVVDDGSRDSTAEAAEATGCRVLKHAINRGYGAALKTGVEHASYDLVAITDADGTYPNRQFPELLEHVEACDMVVGARVKKGAAIPLVRRPAKLALNLLANYLARRPIPDLNSGFRIFRRSEVQRFLPILPDGFSFTTTITLALLTNGYDVEYVPIDYAKRTGKSKIRPIRDTYNFLLLIIRTTLYFDPLRVFLPLGALFALLAVFVGMFTAYVLGDFLDVTTMLIGMTAIQFFVLGLVADLIVHTVLLGKRS